MIYIGICDDDPYIVNEVKEICKATLEPMKDKYTIQTFYSGTDLLNFDKHIDIIFLDVTMPIVDGFQVAEKLREKNEDKVLIIFLTSYNELVQKAFEVQAFRYVYKSDDKLRITQALVDALHVLEEEKKGIWLKIGQHIKFIQYSNIAFIKVRKDFTYIEFLGNKRQELVARSLKWWEENLNKDFVRCHRSYIINCSAIKEFAGNYVVLFNEQKIPVSVRKYTQVKNSYFLSLRNRMYGM